MAARTMGVGLFVSRLHWTVSSVCLRKHFEKFGSVLYSEVLIDGKTGLHKGYGWVRMSSEQEIQSVLGYGRHSIEGYEASVRRDKRDEPQADSPSVADLSLAQDVNRLSEHTTPQTTPTTSSHVTETTPTTSSHVTETTPTTNQAL